MSAILTDYDRVLRDLGSRIRTLRKTRRLTQVDLARRAGLYDVGKIERGESNPSFLTLVKVAVALGVDLAVLFAGDDRRFGHTHRMSRGGFLKTGILRVFASSREAVWPKRRSRPQKAFERAAQLPQEEQDNFARFLLAKLEPEQRWAELFSHPESEDLLERPADEALAAHRAGRTQPLNIEEL